MTPSPATVLVVCDVDSTLFNEEGIDLLAQAAGADVAATVARITAEAMEGRLDFAESLRRRVAALRGLPMTLIEDISAEVTPTRGAAELVQGVHALGGRICAVSGGFHELIDPLAARLGLDRWRANRLAVREGALTGEVEGPIIDAGAKRATLEEWAKEFGVGRERCVAVGDGANDLKMMAWAKIGIGFVPKPIVADHADAVISERNLELALPHVRGLV